MTRLGKRPLFWLGLLWLLLAGAILGLELRRPAEIEIEWVTETEFNTAGFNIYRRDDLDSDFRRLNPSLISSTSDPASGGTYTYIDRDIEPGRTYYYVLEDVELSGEHQRHDDDIIAGSFVRFHWWALAAIPFALLMGTLLLVGSRRS